jgi:DNA-binding response OmpR family regulator
MEPPNQPRVLVVDDDPALRQLLQDYLGLSGYLVDVAEGGEQMRQCMAQPCPRWWCWTSCCPAKTA